MHLNIAWALMEYNICNHCSTCVYMCVGVVVHALYRDQRLSTDKSTNEQLSVETPMRRRMFCYRSISSNLLQASYPLYRYKGAWWCNVCMGQSMYDDPNRSVWNSFTSESCYSSMLVTVSCGMKLTELSTLQAKHDNPFHGNQTAFCMPSWSAAGSALAKIQ